MNTASLQVGADWSPALEKAELASGAISRGSSGVVAVSAVGCGSDGSFCKIMISTAQEFLALMRSEDPADYHRFRHDSAPIEVWRELITKYSLANEWVARNKTSPVEILRDIAGDSRVVVRSEVAMTRRITEDIQERLARDPDASVRNTLANNSKATDRILAILAEDSEAFVRETAHRRIKERQAEQAAP